MTASLYETLGVPRDAGAADIKGAFRKRAKKAHPDGGGSANEFAALNRAYLVLIDPVRRDTYDRTGQADDKPVDNAHVEALVIIKTMMDQIIEQAGERIEADVVAHMRNAMDERVREIGRNVEASRRKAKRLRRIADKFRKKNGENLLRKMVEAKIGGIEHGIESAERMLASIAKAKALLEDYSFEADEPATETIMWTGTILRTGTAG